MRPPKPAALKLLDGNTRKLGKRQFAAGIEAEPKARHGYPECPKHLKGAARAEWDRLTAELTAMGLDAVIDTGSVLAAATLFGRAWDADVYLAEHECVQESPVVVKGELIGYKCEKRPEEAISRQSWELYARFAATLAASVVSRARVAVAGTKKPSEAIDDAIFGT